MTSTIRRSLRSLILIVLFAALAAGSAAGAGLLRSQLAGDLRGVVWEDLPPVSGEQSPGWLGINADLTAMSEQQLKTSLDAMKRLGVAWVRQPFRWAEIERQPGSLEWTKLDAIVQSCDDAGVTLLALLDTSPDWARAAEDAHNPSAPPSNYSSFGAFAAAVAGRYASAIDSYQIWDEPNIQPHWGSGLVDATEYMRLLREAAIQIRSADPTARIVLAGLAPTTERGPLNVNESAYLDALYGADAKPYFDVVSAKAFGFWSGPDDRRLDPGILNFSRLLLMRETMIAHEDSAKPMWAVEIGWNALPAGWAGRESPWGTDTPEKQADRTLQALERARLEWPWLTAIGLAQFGPPADPLDPRAGFAVQDGAGVPRLLYNRLEERGSQPAIAYPGRHRMDDEAVHYTGAWRVRPFAADVRDAGDSLTIRFRGTRIDLSVRRGLFWGFMNVDVDGEAANALPRDPDGRAYLILHDPLEQAETVTLARGLSDGVHDLRLTVDGGWGQWALLGFSVARERPDGGSVPLVAMLALMLVGAGGLAYGLGTAPWRLWWPALLASFERLGDVIQSLVFAVLCAACFFAPSPYVSLMFLAALVVLACLRPALGLALVLFAAPFFLLRGRLPGREVAPAELSLGVATVGLALHVLLNRAAGIVATGTRARFNRMDAAMLLLLAVSLVSLFVAENFGVANREFRVVILEPLVFYLLLRVARLTWRDIRLMAHALILAGLIASLIGMYQWGFTSNIITAEGVRRIKGMYASPNNLSLLLGRVLALLAGLILAYPSRGRRMLYGLIAAPIALCLYLTFSRGALLFGLPAAIIFIALVRRGKTLWVVGIALATIAGSLLPVVGTERLGRLLDMESGTSSLRLKLWQGTLTMIREHPLWGVGLDNFLYQYRTRYILPDAWEEPNLSHPHNIVLDFWTRLGALGIGVLVALHWAFFSLGVRAYRTLADGHERSLSLGLLALIVYSLAHGLIDNSFFLVDLSFIFCWAAASVVWLNGEASTAQSAGSGMAQPLTHPK